MLSKNEKLLLAIKGLYFFGIAIANTFAQVYLYKYTGSFTEMTIYTISRVLMILIFFYLGARLCTRFKAGITMIAGLLQVAFALIWMLVLKETIGTSVIYVYLIGLLWGGGEGFFWFACGALQQYLTTPESRSPYFAISGMLYGIAGIAAPLLSSLILVLTSDLIQGYYRIFEITVFLFSAAAILTLIMKSDYQTSSFSLKGKIFWKKDIRWKWVSIASYLYGIRDAASFSITGLLIYEAAGSEALYGNLASLFALVSVFAYAFSGRLIKIGNEARILQKSAILITISGAVLVFMQNLFGAILHGILFNLAYAFYENSFNILQMEELSYYIHAGEEISERVVVKEGYFDLGRITGFLFMILIMSFFPKSLAMFLCMTILYAFAMILAWYSRKRPKL